MDEPPSYTLLFLLVEPGIIYVILAVLFVFLTSLASATEAAFFSLDTDDLERFRDSIREEEKHVAELQTNPRLLLTTLTACKYTMISGTAVLFVFYLLTTDDHDSTYSIFLGTFILTICFTFFGVIIPKIYGRAHNQIIAMRSAKICKRMIAIYRPLLKPLFKMSYKVEGKLEKLYEQSSSEELNQALQLANANKETSESEKEILQGIVNFGTLSIKQVMRLRADISFADVSLNYFQLMEVVKKSGYSRIPVCDKNLENIEGVLYIKDLLPFLLETESFSWQKLLRPAYFVPESKKIDLLLKEFQEKRVHLGLVVDEFGKVSGLISLEDIIEEIIGDINDESDEIGSHYLKLDNRNYIFDGKTSMHDFCKILHVEDGVFDQAKSENKSLGGMLAEVHGALPKIGEPVMVKPFTFVVEKMDNRRIKKVRVQIHASKEI
ncbi:MAG: gliding motility-associated protein GldE [Cyclobacteriaceae bacterium]